MRTAKQRSMPRIVKATLLEPASDAINQVAVALEWGVRVLDKQGSVVDLMMGIGGTPEGVIAAAAVKCLGGAVQGRLWPRTDEERQSLLDDGYDLDRVLTTDDLVAGDDVFVAATGVTDGALLNGVRLSRDGATTDSIVMRSRSGTVRRIEAYHHLEKLTRFSGREFR